MLLLAGSAIRPLSCFPDLILIIYLFPFSAKSGTKLRKSLEGTKKKRTFAAQLLRNGM
jgi:hypothetical protein